jgi:type I restriction enzyme S subunit
MVRFSNSEINPRFIGHFLASQIFQTLLSSKNDAGAKAGLNLPTVRNFPVLKIELIEQNEITNRLDSMDKNIQIERTNLNKLKLQKSGLMDDLLTGKKRVTNLLNKQPNS